MHLGYVSFSDPLISLAQRAISRYNHLVGQEVKVFCPALANSTGLSIL